MKIVPKLIVSYILVSFLVGTVGYFGYDASEQIIKSFKSTEENLRAIVFSATEISSDVKRAEGHMILFIALNEKKDKERFLKSYNSLKRNISLLKNEISRPEAKETFNKIESKAKDFLPLGKTLMKVYEEDIKKTGYFRPQKYKRLIKKFHDTSSSIRKYGVHLADIETDFLNKQKAITAATEVSSYVKRAEGHLMLFITLDDKKDKAKFTKRYNSLKENISILEDRVKLPEAKVILNKIKSKTDELFPLGIALIKTYEEDIKKTGYFRPQEHKELIKKIHSTVSSIRKNGLILAKINVGLETTLRSTKVEKAKKIQRNIILFIPVTLLAALIIGYFLSIKIVRSIKILKEAADEVGKGTLDTKIEIRSNDEIGDLAKSFASMTEDLKKAKETSQKYNQHLHQEITERKQAEKQLHEKVHELEQFNRLAVGRELVMIELKKQINHLLKELGRQEEYKIAE